MAATFLKKMRYTVGLCRCLSSKSGLIQRGPGLKEFLNLGRASINPGLGSHVEQVPYLGRLDTHGRGNKGLSYHLCVATLITTRYKYELTMLYCSFVLRNIVKINGCAGIIIV